MEKPNLLSTSIMVTEYCSLKCKLCLAFVPYIRDKKHMSLREAKVVFKNYFEMIGMVDKVSITGGEPLINPEISSILCELLCYESKIMKEIILITNGTVLLSDEMIDILKTNSKIKVIVNNYGTISPMAYKNHTLLEENGIRNILYTEENRYDWIDCRDHSLKHELVVDREKQAFSCAFFQGKKYVINRGRLYTCTRAAYRIQENIIPYTQDDYIDLLNEQLDVRQKKLITLLNFKSSGSCAYCDGLTENSLKYKAAEQLNS